MKPRWLIEAGGASLLFLLPYFCPLIMPDHLSVLHHHFPMGNRIGGLLLDLLILMVVGIISLAILTHLPRIFRRIAGAGIAALFIWRTVSVATLLLNMWCVGQLDNRSFARYAFVLGPIVEHWPEYSRSILAASVAASIALAMVKPSSSDAVIRGVRIGLNGFAFCALWIIPELIFMGFSVPGVPRFDHSSTEPARSGTRLEHRIVWILFDELSYGLTLDQPPNGQRYPNFQRLQSQGTSFGNIEPMGSFTDRVIPSLLAGQKLDEVKSTLDGKLLGLNPRSGQAITYDPNRTLFSEAKTSGWNPGVAGWYNPYCRIFVNVLTACSWVPDVHSMLPFEQAGASEDKSILVNSLMLPRALILRVFGRRSGFDAGYIKQDIEDYRSVVLGALDLIQNQNIHFIFIHLPVPHPPGLFNRNTHQFSERGNYLDNLTLADDTLGMLMQEIDRTPSGANTTVIVSSDHSWRVSIWRNDPEWTQEEERLSRRGIDTRPVFLVRFPGQLSGHELSSPRPELIEYDVVESMLKGGISSPDDLDAFVQSSKRQAEGSN
jgi:hypothetical protein